MVSIVGPLKNFIVRACCIPAMKCGHRSCRNLRFGKALLLLPCPLLDGPCSLLQRSTVLFYLRSTVHNYFESSGFESFQCWLAQSSEVSNSRSERSGDTWPLDLDDRDSLREFGLRAFFFCLFVQSFKVRDLPPRVLLFWTVEIYFGVRASGAFFYLLAQFSEVLNSQSERSGDAWPLDLDGRDSL
jgi:hypothetical protein